MHLKNKTFTVSYFECPPLIFTKNGKLAGLEHLILDAVSMALQIQLNFAALNSSDFWGQERNGTWVGGIIGEVHKANVDIGVCGIWLKYSVVQYVDVSVPYSQMSLGFMVSQFRVEQNWKSIYSPFSGVLWCLVLATVVLSVLSLAALSKLAGNRAELAEWGLLVVGHFVGCRSLPRSAARLAAFPVSMAALVLGTLYSSSVVSHLTSPPVVPEPATIRDLVLARYRWTWPDEVIDLGSILDLHDEWQGRMVELYRLPGEMREAVTVRRAALFTRHIGSLRMDIQLPPLLAGLPLRLLPEIAKNHPIGLGFPKGSLLKPHFDRVLQRLIESGLVEKMTSKVASELGTKIKAEGAKEDNRPLGLATLQGAFFLYVGGQTCAFLTFLVEIIKYRHENKMERKKIFLKTWAEPVEVTNLVSSD